MYCTDCTDYTWSITPYILYGMGSYFIK